jgi:hypothetical protein
MDRIHIRRILESIGWTEHYILAFEDAAVRFSQNSETQVYMAHLRASTIGFVFVEYHAWNRLA